VSTAAMMAPTRSTLTCRQRLSLLLASFGEDPVWVHVPVAERLTHALHSGDDLRAAMFGIFDAVRPS